MDSIDTSLPSIERLAELQRLLVKFAEIYRVVPFSKQRSENDSEHSFSLAITCWFLAPKIAPKLSLEKILLYALAHDLVEIYSGDTYVFDQAGQQTKLAREKSSLDRLAREWPDFPELTEAAEGYMNKADAEAKFVYAIDKMLPPLITKTGDDVEFYRRLKITKDMHDTEKANKMRHSPEAAPYLQMLNEWMVKDDTFYKDKH